MNSSRARSLVFWRSSNSKLETLDAGQILVGMLVEVRLHARLGADARESFFELFTQVRIFFVVRDRRAAVFHVDGAVVDSFFTGSAAIAPGRIGAEPSGQTERFFARPKVSVEPVAAHWSRTDHAH